MPNAHATSTLHAKASSEALERISRNATGEQLANEVESVARSAHTHRISLDNSACGAARALARTLTNRTYASGTRVKTLRAIEALARASPHALVASWPVLLGGGSADGGVVGRTLKTRDYRERAAAADALSALVTGAHTTRAGRKHCSTRLHTGRRHGSRHRRSSL